jgi:TPR repeat protein
MKYYLREQYSLGYMYEFGEFFVKDLVAAAIWHYLSAIMTTRMQKLVLIG